MHPLLERQLRRHAGVRNPVLPGLTALLESVSDAYEAADRDRARLERSMDLMSRELVASNQELRRDITLRVVVEDALRESEARLRSEIADRERIEVELRLKQKLEAVGQLAAGIAHEINTPIQYVGDSVHFLQSAFDDYRAALARWRAARTHLPAAVAASLEAADEAADLPFLEQEVPLAFDRVREGTAHVAQIVRAVKDFAHPDRTDFAPADLNRALASTLVVTRNEYKYAADVLTDFGDLPPVECRIGDLNQVFLNLVVNAAHAIEDRAAAGGPARGTITVRSRADGDEVVVEVGDTGCGIPTTIHGRVFDPFFTTKEVGRGTGQGLAIARSIVVDKHHGTITFETREGEGTTFRLRLPVGQAHRVAA